LCQPGTTPSQRELDNFFNNFLNPNSFVQINIDPDGIIRVEEPAEVLYQIEEPGEGAKILSIEQKVYYRSLQLWHSSALSIQALQTLKRLTNGSKN
jgi:hypothetical protein